MKRFVKYALLGALLVVLSGMTPAQRTVMFSGSSYKGPANAIAGMTACWSLRACSSAKRGSAAVNVCNITGAVEVGCGDLFTNPISGNLVSGSISGITCPGANCAVKIIYDQIGSNNMLTDAAVAKRPLIVANCINTSLPCMTFDGTSQYMVATSVVVSANPVTLTTAVMIQSGTIDGDWVYVDQNKIGIWAGTGNNTSTCGTGTNCLWNYAGIAPVAGLPVMVLDTFNAFVGVFNGASSVDNLNNSSVTQNNGVNTLGGGGGKLTLGSLDTASQFSKMKAVEFGLWTGIGFTGPQQSTMCHNIFSYWATSVAC